MECCLKTRNRKKISDEGRKKNNSGEENTLFGLQSHEYVGESLSVLFVSDCETWSGESFPRNKFDQ